MTNSKVSIQRHDKGVYYQQIEAATANNQFRPEFDEAAAHRRAKPGAAAGDQDPLSCQQAFFKHRFTPLLSRHCL